jgi:3D (Asp-Asp-Asp) domain-containing protein
MECRIFVLNLVSNATAPVTEVKNLVEINLVSLDPRVIRLNGTYLMLKDRDIVAYRE